jgi:hypothetical protein
MKHLSEEQLIEHHYGKAPDSAAAQHLASCPECAGARAALQADLAEMDFAPPPARDAAYGERVWQSIAPFLPAYEKQKRSWLPAGLFAGLGYAAACAVLMLCAFFAGRQWEHKQATVAHAPAVPVQPSPALAQKRVAPPPQRVVVVVLGDHLDRSERLLVELKHADADSPEMFSPLRDEARSLLAANRICRKNARQEDDPALSSALDHLDRVLDELANPPGSLDAAELLRLQNEMNASGLLFEVRVLRSRAPDRLPRGKYRSNGGTI